MPRSGSLTLERDFLKKSVGEPSLNKRIALARQGTLGKGLSRRCKCGLMVINRSTVYYERRTNKDQDIDMMNKIQELHDAYPFYGYRKITAHLRPVRAIKSTQRECGD